MNNNEFYKKIDEDTGLKSKRTMLTTVSLILLSIQFSGAKITEANTFILKLEFSHQNGISLFLTLIIIFLLIRYYNYARPYHNELNRIWISKLINDCKINVYDSYNHELIGILHSKYPERYPDEAIMYGGSITTSYDYECKFFFIRNFVYKWEDEHDTHTDRLNIFKSLGVKKYLIVLKIEGKHQFSRFFTHRENLDILSPYILGVSAVFSYIFNNELHKLLEVVFKINL